MGTGDTVINMPTDLRNDQHVDDSANIELEPLHHHYHSSNGRSRAGKEPGPSRRGILRLTVDVPLSNSPKAGLARPPRWRTPEFFVYGVVFAVVVPLMIWKPVDLSRGMFLIWFWFCTFGLCTDYIWWYRDASQLSFIFISSSRGMVVWEENCECLCPCWYTGTYSITGQQRYSISYGPK